MDEIQDLVNAGKLSEAAELSKTCAINFLQNAALINLNNGEWEKAIQQAKLCISIDPTIAKSWGNLSYFYGSQMQLEEALASVDKALSLEYSNEFLFNKAVILSGLRKIDESIQCYEEIVENDPKSYYSYFNLGCLLMLKGDYKQGLSYLEYRFKYDGSLAKFRKRFTKPDWQGEDLTGKRLLVYSEQGAGDVIQYVRYIPMLNCVCIAEMQEELADLLSGFFYTVIGRSQDYDVSLPCDLPEYDYIVSFSSLPYLLDPELKNVPKTPYLKVKDMDLSLDGKFNIGIAWAGSPGHSNDINRSCSVKNFLPLTKIPGVQLYSLQKDNIERKHFGKNMQLGKGFDGIIDLSDKLDNFYTTAQFIDKMDLIITVDTAVAHLAGALGKETWVLLSVCSDYRWLMDGEDTFWYKSMKLFRQKKIGDWDELINRVKLNLEGKI